LEKQFSHAASIFPVDDPMGAARYYQEQLGFDIHFVWGEPAEYVITNREEAVNIHFVKKLDLFEPSKDHVSLYVFVHQVDQLYHELQSKEVEIIEAPVTEEWGMRTFSIKDPNGFILTFGTHIDRLNQ
jgi:uncharacterized glyoxalase superfamily protein PhnB